MWDSVGPLLDRVMTQGQDVSTLTDQLFLLNRNGYLEECYFATSFSPIPDDTGGVGGVLNTALEQRNGSSRIDADSCCVIWRRERDKREPRAWSGASAKKPSVNIA